MDVTIKLTIVPLVLLAILLIIGCLVILWIWIKIPQLLWKYCLAYYCGAGVKWKGGPDTWAVITGATDGIGLAYAKAMADMGYSLVLMSRSPDKLDRVKTEIHKEYKNCAKIKIIVVDFADEDIYDKIESELKELPEIHVLINNVGMTYRYPEFFTRIDDQSEFITRIFNINCMAMTKLISLVLPAMADRRSGVILNICSFSACFPTPLLALYSASKTYGDYLSRALSVEYGHKGVVIQSVLPYYVSTNMIRNPKHTFMIPSSDRFVRSALKTVGIESRTYGYLPHTVVAFIQIFVIKFLVGNDVNMKLAFRKMFRFRKAYCAKRDKYAQSMDTLDSVIDIRL
ncbi:unnamed protein product [Medioppia subpectinata]|uniref:Steroid dehydrogenase n=1 Tax=Medioppia subpectinata TaxID=1979941 RepID=A0A7R9PXT2_9ACAR|nr:unnamed protein product [Medioppia subpectinata]CAG2105143.1 unnamed protein product [Medioppia subpectinata]